MSLAFKHGREKSRQFVAAALRCFFVSFNERDTLVFENAVIND